MKSNVSDYLRLVEQVYIDATTKCIADVSDLRDLETIRSRVENEGLSFLTITLPQFGRDFERSLVNGCIDSTTFLGFKKVGSIPAFLQGMISLIFDRETGKAIEYDLSPNNYGGMSSDIPTLVESVRQICLTFKKVELECTPERLQTALDSFISIEHSFETFNVPKEDYFEFLEVSSVLWDNMVVDFSPTTCTPKHGPGATAEHISGNQKYQWERWHDRLEPYFPLVDNGYPLGIPADSEELKMVSIIPPELEQPVRVVPVPKTLKGPRIIAIEPCCMQYVQQGVRDFLYRKIESYWLTAGHVNFTDQSINQKLAVSSSLTGQLATIDLSDASDRVPRDFALDMFRGNPDLQGAIEACRSTRAELPDGRLVDPLKKFASMGSALCFPVEAMYFYTVCVVALLKAQALPITASNIFLVTRSLYVYGDDIIVPTTNAMIVLDYLQKYNCKVNVNKTFVSGSFRESCGVDAYAGYEVTPTYLRKPRPESKRQASQVISWVATANQFYLKGYWHTAQFMFEELEQVVGSLPYALESSEALSRFSFLGFETIGRWNRYLQRNEIRALVPRPIHRSDVLDGYGALTKCFLGLHSMPETGNLCSQDSSQLELSALHGAVALKLRWTPTH